MAFGYELKLTGDCSSLGTGIISILPSGGTPPYTVVWYNPALPPTNTVVDTPSVRTGLYTGLYQVSINDSSEPVNLEALVNVSLSNGCCAKILGVTGTTCNQNNGSVEVSASTLSSAVDLLVYTTGGTVVDYVISSLPFFEFCFF